jgi:hypothetical protein
VGSQFDFSVVIQRRQDAVHWHHCRDAAANIPYLNKFDVPYIQDQVYLNPHPKELMLLNHV